MITTIDCMPCFTRQMIKAIRIFTDDEKKQQQYLRKILIRMSLLDHSLSPPALSLELYDILNQETGKEDPYYELKKEHNSLIMSISPMIESFIDSSSDTFYAALNMAIAGNIIDFGANDNLETTQVLASLFQAQQEHVNGDIERFRESISNAKSIVYLCDNAGEIVLDRLFIKQLPKKIVTAVVKGSPAINDALMEDAFQVGLQDVAKVIDNGSRAPGTLLPDCSKHFLEVLNSADCIISKGQGNFESLNQTNLPIFFLFKVKCDPLSKIVGKPIGTHMLVNNRK
ncbi:MAG: DUF89 family protein [Caldisericia bacterium]|nr:DUF89 family protein [Caldisericia bacterium]